MEDKVVCKHGIYKELCWACPAQELIAKDLIKDITSEPPTTWDNLSESIGILTHMIKEYPYLWTPAVSNWVRQANEILRDLDEDI